MEKVGFRRLGLNDSYVKMIKKYMKFEECKNINTFNEKYNMNILKSKIFYVTVIIILFSFTYVASAIPYGTGNYGEGLYNELCQTGDMDCDGNISTGELLAYIHEWMDDGDSILDLIDVIYMWRN